MTGIICNQCMKASDEPRSPTCERKDCPGKATFFDGFLAASRLFTGQYDRYAELRDMALGKKTKRKS